MSPGPGPFPPLLARAGALQSVGRDAWAWMQLPGSWGETNAGLVSGSGQSVLIDTLWDQRLTRVMLAAMGPHTERSPVSLVVNTHSDGDHWWGNAEAPAAAEIVTSDAALAAMREEAPPASLARLGRLSRRLGTVPGRPGRAGRYIGAMLAPYELDQVELRLPGRSFAGRRTETVGGREIELIDFGAAHTASDVAVFVPDARLVYVGDLLFNEVTPVMWHGPVANWLGALEGLLELEADTFVPGHGAVGDRRLVQAMQDYLSWVAGSVTTHHAAGRGSAEAARRMIDEPGFAQFREWPSPERLAITVATIHRQLSGLGPVPTTPAARGRVFDAVASLREAIR